MLPPGRWYENEVVEKKFCVEKGRPLMFYTKGIKDS